MLGVHTHVERSVVAIGEPASTAVQLRRRHTEVEERAADLVDAELLERLGELIESAPGRPHAWSEFCQPFGGRGDSLGIPIDPEDVDVVALGEKRGAVPATTEGCIDDGSGGDAREQLGDLVDHHRGVIEGVVGAHRATPAISC